MQQRPFPWAEQTSVDERSDSAKLDRETKEAVIALMARLLVALVRGDEEAGDER